MANKTVLDFDALTSIAATDVLYVIRGTEAGRDKRVTVANLFKNIPTAVFVDVPDEVDVPLAVRQDGVYLFEINEQYTRVRNKLVAFPSNYEGSAGFNLGASTGVAAGFPNDGDIYHLGVGDLRIYSGTTRYKFAFLNKAQTWENIQTFQEGVVLGGASNGFNIRSVDSDTYGIWRTAVASPSLSNYAFALTSEASLLHGPLRAGLLVANSYKVKATSSGVELFTDATAGINRIFFKRYHTTQYPVMFMGVAEGSETILNHTLLVTATDGTELNNESQVGLTIAGSWRIKCSTALIELFPTNANRAMYISDTQIVCEKNLIANYFGAYTGATATTYTSLGTALTLAPSPRNHYRYHASGSRAVLTLTTTNMAVGESCFITLRTGSGAPDLRAELRYPDFTGGNPRYMLQVNTECEVSTYFVTRMGNGFIVVGSPVCDATAV